MAADSVDSHHAPAAQALAPIPRSRPLPSNKTQLLCHPRQCHFVSWPSATSRVFPSYPQVARYFPGRSIEDARGRLGRAIERGDGPGLVIGGPGTGKSLLLQVLAGQFQDRFDVVLPACARLCTRRALLQSILFELGLPYRSRDEGELRLSLLDHLLSKEDCPAGLLLLVDEAQTLPVALLDELRVLTNLVRSGLPRVRLVLAGSSSLEECFADPELESFSQRLTARCYLGPFTQEETTQFIRAQFAASGAVPDEVFAPETWHAVFEATDGVPRLVNQLCDRAVGEAIAQGHTLVDRKSIQAAWADIQQLPTPWDTPEPPPEASTSPTIEFGDLAGGNSVFRTFDVKTDDDASEDAVLSVVMAETDTELDIDDKPGDQPITTESRVETRQIISKPLKPAVDPFAEKFDEEEIVLDNFAAWDDMFRRDAPRVANRRDPGFAALVEVALKAEPAGKRLRNSPVDSSSPKVDRRDVVPKDSASRGTAELESNIDWPQLRIADVAEVHASPQIPLSWPDGDPVLIVEEDAAILDSPKPQVRREEYRHLFSRLRSG